MKNLSGQPPSSILTWKRIACSQLRTGMYLVRILDSWWRSPFFIHRRLLRSQDVQLLLRSGIREVEIDTAKGLDVVLGSEPVPEDQPADTHRTEISGDHHKIDSPKENDLYPGSPVPEPDRYEQLSKLRGDAIAALEKMFEGAKTGHALPPDVFQVTAGELIQKALAHPALLAEVMLIEQLEHFDKTLYSHAVDTAVLSILVGLQLEWDVKLLEEVAVAALLHDVGYMRLPRNLVQAQWGTTGNDGFLLRQHVEMALALIHKQSHFSREIVQMIREHHAYQDGSGYPEMQGGQALSASGKLLGLVDYFDELLAEGNAARSFPAALAIRRMYQETQKGKFPTIFMEAMIRVLGVYPVGTFVALSTGEKAVVVKQNPKVSVKPFVKIIRASDGQVIREPEMRNLALGAKRENEVKIVEILESADPAINLNGIFS